MVQIYHAAAAVRGFRSLSTRATYCGADVYGPYFSTIFGEVSMKPLVLAPAFAFAVYAFSAHAAMTIVPYVGPPGVKYDSEPNRLTGSRSVKPDSWGSRIDPLLPHLAPSDLQAQPPQRERGPGFLNADPFDPNSVVNSYERSLYANPYPYDPVYNPYGQGASNYAPRGGANVPMGNGIRPGR
jgi:hypothetical protein